MNETASTVDEKPHDCDRNEPNPQLQSKLLVAHIVREVNRQKITYNQLREIFQKVRVRCELRVKRTGRKLYVLPTQKDIDNFYAAIESPSHRLIFETLESTGLREAELCNLQVKKIDFAANTFFITGKGDKDRIVLISNRLKEKLLLHLELRRNRYLFETNRKTKYSTRRLQQLAQMYKEKAGIVDKQLSPHTFRHRHFTLLAEAGVTTEKREILAGHAQGSKTQAIYTHLTVGGLKDEILNVLEKLNL